MDAKVDPTNRGREAASPWQMPLRAWKDVAVRVWNESWMDNIGLVAAGVAFYGFLALVPLLGILVLTYGLFTDPQTVVEHVRVMLRILPPEIVQLIAQLLLDAVQSSEETSGLGILLALIVALYAGGNGAGAIMTALNIAFEQVERRSLARFYAIALTITTAGVLLVLTGLAAVASVQALEEILPHAPAAFVGLGQVVLYVLMTFVAAALVATLYRYGPSHEDARWQWLTPGSVFTSLLWLALTSGFGFYVTRLTDFNAMYGSIAAIVMLLTWLYLSVYVFLLGAELNAEFEHRTAGDTTTG